MHANIFTMLLQARSLALHMANWLNFVLRLLRFYTHLNLTVWCRCSSIAAFDTQQTQTHTHVPEPVEPVDVNTFRTRRARSFIETKCFRVARFVLMYPRPAFARSPFITVIINGIRVCVPRSRAEHACV